MRGLLDLLRRLGAALFPRRAEPRFDAELARALERLEPAPLVSPQKLNQQER